MNKQKKQIPVAGTKPVPMEYFSVPRVPEPEVVDNTPNWRDRVREIVTPIWFDYHGSHFFDGDNKMIAQIRGWGGLTSSGLSDEEARSIQEKNAAFIVNAVNEYETLSAIRMAVAALVESIDSVVKEVDELIRERDFMSPSDFMDSEGRGHGTTLEGWMRSYSDYCIDQAIGNVRWLKNISGVKAKLAALKAVL